MVTEFPDLQGVMGRYYALDLRKPAEEYQDDPQRYAIGEDTEHEDVANAIRDHYQPQGPSNPVPTAPVSIAVALADKLDTLVGFWAIDEKPTGSKDPFALRRAALGVVRIVLENGVRISLNEIGSKADFGLGERVSGQQGGDWRGYGANLLSFFADRLKQYLRDKGERHDLIDAVFALGEDDLVLITKRVEALGAFLETEDGTNLLAGYKRATNILRAEEKKTAETYTGPVNPDLLSEKPEQDLHSALTKATAKVEAALGTESFDKAMAAMAPLRGSLDTFFDHVTVNVDDSAIRRNRLLLLASMRDALANVADFSRIEG